MSKLEQQFNELKTQFDLLKAEHDWLKQVCRLMFGVAEPWMSPAKASPILGWSRDRIVDEIKLAERARALGKPFDVKYGVHYRNDQSLDATEATWKVNIIAFSEVLRIPPDQRIGGV